MSLLELFVSVDDFCQIFLPVWKQKLFADGSKKRHHAGQMGVSEIMTIIIYEPLSRASWISSRTFLKLSILVIVARSMLLSIVLLV